MTMLQMDVVLLQMQLTGKLGGIFMMTISFAMMPNFACQADLAEELSLMSGCASQFS